MTTTRYYVRLSAAELTDLRSRPDDAADVLFQFWNDDHGGGGRVCDIDKWWIEQDLVLTTAGITLADANGSDHLYPLEPGQAEDWDLQQMSEADRRMQAPPTYLTPEAVQALAARLSSLDLEAAFDAVDQTRWDELLAGPSDYFRDAVLPELRSFTKFVTSAAGAGDALVSSPG